ncbi:glycoside hydrolase family 18 protein [Francisella frigiditurris]|uniref:chitinase n=1 Tax=Francisella frigiditurris TaxID=1542390 RepID=A0A1J0KSD9_9GAMM|nr:glycoside hydrolase family 18 protein [Francisella frigiditurris]APC96610.1 glycosyl hydrolases 18 family protein [Francisella frigiditurris]
MKKLNKISLITMLCMGTVGFANANCVQDDVSTGWTGSLTFHCTEDTDLVKNPISFKVSNNIKVSSMWGLPGNSQFTQNGDTISVTVKKWWPDEAYIAQAGQYYTLSFSPNTNNFAISEFSVNSQDGGQEASKATIKINLPEKPQFIGTSKANVIIYKDGVKVAEMKDTAWGSSQSFEAEGNVGYTINVPAIDNATGSATPANFTTTGGQTQEVNIQYTAPKVDYKGNITISASTPDSTTKTPSYTLTDAQGNVIKEGALNFNAPTNLNDIPTSANGKQYQLTVDGYAENGFNYTAKSVSVVVKNTETTEAKVEYTKEAMPTEKVNVEVKGIPSGKSSTLTLKNDNGKIITSKLNADGISSIDVPKDGENWNITASSFDDYKVTVSPANFTANQNTQNITITFAEQQKSTQDEFITGYWENWKPAQQPQSTDMGNPAHYSTDIAPYTHVVYSFLTLAKNPNPDNPSNTTWDGSAIYESMTAGDVLKFMREYPEGTPNWERTDNWMRVRVDALIKATHDNNGKFIWAIGGWSDLQQTISTNQVDKLVSMIVDLLKISGDGVDFDWEHLHQLADGSKNPNAQQQTAVLAEVLLKLRQALDKAGLQDKQIGYTTRFNAFMADSKQYGFPGFNSDGEGLAIDNWLKAHGSSLNNVVDFVNIMAYDVGPEYMPNGQTWNMNIYKNVLSTFGAHVDSSKVVLGFEPGGQAAGGQWEGMAVDKQAIDYVANNGYGGSMFWAINQPPYNSTENTGLNSDKLAKYSQDKFSNN